MITFMTHWSRETSLLIEGPPFFKIAAAIIDHAANIGQISIKPHPKTHFEKCKPVVILESGCYIHNLDYPKDGTRGGRVSDIG